MYQGTSAVSQDAKGRILIPARHRDALLLQSEGRITLTRSIDGCLLLYPRPVWEEQRQKIVAWPFNLRHMRRLLLGSALDVEMDSTGRILISPELRKAAELKREVLLLGMGSHFEIWDADKHAESEKEALATSIHDGLHDFSF